MSESPSSPSMPIGGVAAAFLTPIFLGMAPIFGKLAIRAGADPFSVAALRTIVAVALLWGFYALFLRRYIYIYPAGLLGCIVIGAVNGIGSLFYYGGLSMLDASMTQLLNGMYLPLAVLISSSAGQKVDSRTYLRVSLALLALIMITGFSPTEINWTGVGFMLGSALMFAGTVTLSQYVLYEMPSPTVTLYVLTTMGAIVCIVWLAVGNPLSPEVVSASFSPIVILGITTALSRLAMFAGVKLFGGMQTAILAIAEIGVALTLAFVVLGDRLAIEQWFGVAVLFGSILLVRQRDLSPTGFNPNQLIVANMASVQFQRIAFHRAFGTDVDDNELGTMGTITTQELVAIQRMMGAESGPIDPFPIGKTRHLNQMTAALPPDLFETQEVEIPKELRQEIAQDVAEELHELIENSELNEPDD